MRDAPMRHATERMWMLSPALATGLFFALKLALGAVDPWVSSERVAGAGAETPVAMPTQIRVVSELRRADVALRSRRIVPDTEADLMRLFEQEGTVTFLSTEVEIVATSAPEFEAERLEVEVSSEDDAQP